MARYYGVPLRNGLPIGLGSAISLRKPGGAAAAVPDPYFEYTTLLLPGNGTNGAQNNTFLDSSTNAFTITRNGNTTQGTFSPFSQTGWGNYFDGTGDYLSIARNSVFLPGASTDFTVEAWVYPIAISAASSPILCMGEFGDRANTDWLFALNADRTVYFYLASTNVARTTAATVTLNAWNHVAVARTGTGSNNLTIYVNGVGQSFTETGAFTYSGSSQLTIGADVNGDEGLYTGYFSNIRMVNGTAVYSGATITVPTAPLTAVTNTCLLTCQSNRFIDNSTNNFAITANGDVSVQAFSPFNPTAAWSAATNGGSGYFDGSGDALYTTGNQLPANFDSSDWTAEAWVYIQTMTAAPTVIWANQSGTNRYFSFIGFDSSGTFYTNNVLGGSSVTWAVTGSVPGFGVGKWMHFAAVRSGTNIMQFVDGVRISNTAGIATTSIAASDYNFGSGGFNGSFVQPLQGYISGARVVLGTALYTGSTYTVPTAPLTAVSNTSILLNFTNAGIYDATSKNDLETVGNAQISTTQSKFGGSSMYFDGTGDWLLTPTNARLMEIGSGDFTVEAWIYVANTTGGKAVIDFRTGSADTAGFYFGLNGSQLQIYAQGVINLSAGSISATTWTHVACVRYSGTIYLYVNGTSVGSTANTTNWTRTVATVGAAILGGGEPMNGYINDLRVTKGIARYTANFTPPTAAFPLL